MHFLLKHLKNICFSSKNKMHSKYISFTAKFTWLGFFYFWSTSMFFEISFCEFFDLNNGLPCNVINCKYDHYLPSYYNNIIHLNQNKNNSVIDENIKEQNVNEKTNELKKQLVIKTINLKNNIDDIIIDLFVSVPELRDLIHKAFEKGMKP
jgi:hypothetical protein